MANQSEKSKTKYEYFKGIIVYSQFFIQDWIHIRETCKCLLSCPSDWTISGFKASAHSFKQFTSRLLKSTFSLSVHITVFNCTIF